MAGRDKYDDEMLCENCEEMFCFDLVGGVKLGPYRFCSATCCNSWWGYLEQERALAKAGQ